MTYSAVVHRVVLVGLATVLLAGNAVAESMQQAWDTALAADLGLKASRESTASAAEMVNAAKSSRLPNVALEAGRVILEEAPAFNVDVLGQSLQFPVMQSDSTAYRAMATLPLYTGGRIGQGIDAASAAYAAARLGETGQTQVVKLRVADAYVGVLRMEQLLKVAASHVSSLEAHAGQAGNLFKQGLVARNDLLSAEVARADAQQIFLQTANGLDIARAAYNRLLGRPLDQAVVLDEISPEVVDEPLPTLTQRALARRSELGMLSQQVEALRHQAAAVSRETYPQVALSGGYGYLEDRYLVPEGQWMVMLGLKWNVFDGGVASHRTGAIEHQAAALANQRNELASVIALQVRQTWLEVEETRKRSGVTLSAIAQADENLRVTRDRYANGLVTHTEVLDAEALRVHSETSHAQAVFDGVMAGLRLKWATGEL